MNEALLEAHIVSNLIVAALLVGAALAFTAARRSVLWSRAGRELLRRRPIALATILVFVMVALLKADPRTKDAADELS